MTSIFEQWTSADVADLIASYPLASIAPRSAPAEVTALLPLIAERDAEGHVNRLIGHMSRTNPLRAVLEADSSARILFQGPQGYISPAVAGLRDWAPTWNFAQVRIDAEVVFEPAGLDAALDVLVSHMEAGRDTPWAIDGLGPRAERLKTRIIAFSARPTRISAVFKLGQDETPETLSHILRGLGDCDLARWMRRFNAERLVA
ncbi:MAG TPA: FMN-binding negative transcriptional regulator [Solirubrobacterales bacterium]|nr:FMN-binding negative transcriptional regulator [Solirubrobacterales bacterium]